jgi:hypothetical protein
LLREDWGLTTPALLMPYVFEKQAYRNFNEQARIAPVRYITAVFIIIDPVGSGA